MNGPEKSFMDEVTSGKVFQVNSAQIFEKQLVYTTLTYFHEVNEKENNFNCFSENDFITSVSLQKEKTQEKKRGVNHNVLLMKVIGKYKPPVSRKGHRRGIVQLADKHTDEPFQLVTFGNEETIQKVHDSAIIGNWIKVTNFVYKKWLNTISLTNYSRNPLVNISDMEKFPWLKDLEIPTRGANGMFTNIKSLHYYSSCQNCTRIEECCVCPEGHMSLKQKCTLQLLFISSENETHELIVYYKTLKDLHLIDDDDVKELPPKENFKELIKERMFYKRTDIQWFVPLKIYKKEKKIVKVLTSVSPFN